MSQTRWRELIEAYLLGTISDEESQELEIALLAHGEARKDFRQRCNMDVALRHEASRLSVGELSKTPSQRSGRPFTRRVWLSLAACLTFLMSFAAVYRFSRSDANDLQVVSVEDARLVNRADRLLVGEKLPLSELELESGFLRVRLGNGVLLDLNGPLALTFESGMKMRLLHGRMSVDVGSEGEGFTVVTDAGEVVDLGTRFCVEADAKGESRVAVFTGEVQVRTGGSGREFTKIYEGEAVRFTALTGLRRWTEVALAVDAAGLERTPTQGVIASARDNLGNDKRHPFYGIVHEGMRPGALAFTDKPNPRWAPMSGDTLPTWLLGADLVRTYHQFRYKRNYTLTLTLREAAEVSVLIDTRQEPPSWLKDRFTDSGARVRVGPWMQSMAKTEGVEIDADGQPYRIFAVWRASSAAGELMLGPAQLEEQKDASIALMYGVAVKALPPKSLNSN
jgi:FecR protein